jgi:alpha-D-ribose 1-methylphosphonate 5-triphosphate synthase subunit PhnG
VTVTSQRSDGLPLTDPFSAGQTAITWTATNNVGSASCTQIISVVGADSEPPTLHVPANVTTSTDQCSVSLDDELFVATAEDNCSSSVNISRTGMPQIACPTPGNPNRTCDSFVFPTGTTVITYTATDSAGNSTSGTQTVRVNENPNINPTITAPASLTVNTGPGATSCGTFVGDATLGTATANDNCPGFVVTRSGVPAGNNFPVGNTTVTYTVTDRVGNTAQATQTVTVVDNTVPVVTPPAAVTLYTGPGATSCSVTVSNLDATLGTASATDNCPAPSGGFDINRSGVPAGNVFPVGQTTLTYSTVDAHGNSGSAQQVVTVVDNTAPVISCPANIVLEPTCPTGAIATFADATATDNCGVQSVVRTAGPASGSVFPIGTTTVTFTATDIYSNTSSCSFTVTVKTPQQVLQDMINAINGYANLSGTQKQGLISKLQAAIDAINQGKTNVACNKLSDFNSQVSGYIGNGTLTAAQGNALLSSSNHVRNTIGCTNNPCT